MSRPSFTKGAPNPAGRRAASQAFRDVVKLAKRGSFRAMEFLLELIDEPKASLATRKAAAESVLEWAFRGEMTPNETEAAQNIATATPDQKIALYRRAIEAEEAKKAEQGATH